MVITICAAPSEHMQRRIAYSTSLYKRRRRRLARCSAELERNLVRELQCTRCTSAGRNLLLCDIHVVECSATVLQLPCAVAPPGDALLRLKDRAQLRSFAPRRMCPAKRLSVHMRRVALLWRVAPSTAGYTKVHRVSHAPRPDR